MADKSQIKKMFKTISPTYDLLNGLLSLNIHKWWKRKTIALFKPQWKEEKKETRMSQGGAKKKEIILDLCSGTLDLSLQILKSSPSHTRVLALDFCFEMLQEGKKKMPSEQQERLWLVCADIEHLPLKSNIARGAVMGFGLRNLINRSKGLEEINRALKPSAKLAVLEFSHPKSKVFQSLYYFYSLQILPFIGGLISGNREAYRYLPDSILKFYTPLQLKEVMERVGFVKVSFSLLTGGIAALHVGEKGSCR